MRKSFVSLLLVVLFACHNDDAVSPTVSYINNMLDIMQANSMNKADIDWQTLRSNVVQQASGAQSINELQPAIKLALQGLGDHHSFYLSSDGSNYVFGDPLSCPVPSVTFRIEEPNIGAIKILAYSGNDPNGHADQIQNIIKEEDQDIDDIIGWLVDLRGNTGGNMWPMIAGLGPILGNNMLGYFVLPDQTKEAWAYSNGSALLESNVMCKVSEAYYLKKPAPKVAVLVDQGTASSGEATAIAFMGRSNTRIFGTSTCGLSTDNRSYKLSDGAMLYLTVGVMADRNQNLKGGPLVPDETIAGDTEVIDAAIAWLKQP